MVSKRQWDKYERKTVFKKRFIKLNNAENAFRTLNLERFRSGPCFLERPASYKLSLQGPIETATHYRDDHGIKIVFKHKVNLLVSNFIFHM